MHGESRNTIVQMMVVTGNELHASTCTHTRSHCPRRAQASIGTEHLIRGATRWIAADSPRDMEGQHRINLTWSADSRDDGYEDADADQWMPVLEMNWNG